MGLPGDSELTNQAETSRTSLFSKIQNAFEIYTIQVATVHSDWRTEN